MRSIPASWLVIAAGVFGVPRIAVAEPAACEVRIVSAPADVRDAVAAAIQAEWTCSSLEIRVVATDSGYLVRAQRTDGLVLEMVAADAQRVGTLVATWATEGAPPPPSPSSTPQIAVDLQWTPPGYTPQIDVQLQWTPSRAVERQWTPPSTSNDVGLIPQ